MSRDPAGGTVHRTVLPTGLRVLTEQVPGVRSVTLGFWVAIGSRDEPPPLNGVSHFLEHLLFKGTHRRSALDISAAVEAVGGETNAFTTKEYTCFYVRVLDTHLPLAVDVLADLIADSLLTPADVETERAVILEEIAMHDDEPGDEVHDVFARAVYGDHPLGRLISGTTGTIQAMTRQQIHGFYRRWYTPPVMVVTAAGNVDHAAVVALVRGALSGTPLATGEADPVAPRVGGPPVPLATARTLVEPKDTEQAHVVLGAPGLTRADERRFALEVLNNVVGGGMSSRLFQEIRERRGLAYSIYSYTSLFADSGLFAVYAGCAPGKVAEVLDVVRAELAALARHGVTADELDRGKGMLRGSLVLALEDTGSRMSRLGRGELLHDRLLSVDHLLRRVERVGLAEVNEVAEEVLSGPQSLAAVGPLDSLG